MRYAKLPLITLLVCAACTCAAFGSTSLFNVQTTETIDKGKYELKLKADKKRSENSYHVFSSFKYGFAKNFEMGVNTLLTDNKETVLYCKYRVFDGKCGWPSFAAGINKIKVNAPSSFYAVITKPIGSFKLSVEALFENNRVGIMEGFEVPVGKSVLFMVDHINTKYNLTTAGFSVKAMPGCDIKFGYGFSANPQNNCVNLQFIYKGRW